MTRVDRMEQLLDSLRQQLLDKVATRRPEAGSTASTDPSQSSGSSRGEPIEELRKRISREMHSYDLSSSAGRRRARISFLESVLSWDLGDSVVRDPKFSELVESIEEAIGQDSGVSGQLDSLLLSLMQLPAV